MTTKIKTFFFTSIALFGSFIQLCAQNKTAEVKDTLETVFHNEPHKDGYIVNGHILEMPEAIAVKCDKKKIRVIGVTSFYKSVYDANHSEDTTIRQGRYEAVPVEDDSGKIKFKSRLVSTGSSFTIISIAVWDNLKNKWKIVFAPKK